MSAGRVLATQQAKDAAKQLLALTGQVKDKVERVVQQGGILADPQRWDGGLAGKWRNQWGQDGNQLKQTAAKLEALERKAQQVIDDILKAGDGSLGAEPPTADPNPAGQGHGFWETLGDDAWTQGTFLGAGLATGIPGTAASQSDRWDEIAETREEQVKALNRIAGETDDPAVKTAATRAANVFESAADRAANAADSNLWYSARSAGTKVGDILAASWRDIPGIGAKLPEIAEKLPIVGGVIAAGQTVWDGEHTGNWGQAAGADLGGYVAGSAATEGALALAASVGLAGGPVTLGAVVIGVGVAYGVGEIVNHWPSIEHGISNAADAAGHFFSSIF